MASVYRQKLLQIIVFLRYIGMGHYKGKCLNRNIRIISVNLSSDVDQDT